MLDLARQIKQRIDRGKTPYCTLLVEDFDRIYPATTGRTPISHAPQLCLTLCTPAGAPCQPNCSVNVALPTKTPFS